MIVSFDDFILGYRIPNLHSTVGVEDKIHSAIQKKVMEFMEKYEPNYLLQFLGSKENVNELYAYHDLEESLKKDEDKNTLIKSLKLTISKFVAYYYFKDNAVPNTGIGGTLPQGENSTRSNNMDRLVNIWNDMVIEGRNAYIRFFGYRYPDIKPSTFQDNIFKFKNPFGI